MSGLEGGPVRLSPRVYDWSGVYFFSSTWSDDSCALTRSRQPLELPSARTLGPVSCRGKPPGVGGRLGQHWGLQGEGPRGRCLPG